MKDYSDIIKMPHHTSKTRERMPLRNRAAQFAPFSALTGYDESIFEEGRLTNKRIFLDENQKSILNEKLQYINDNKNTEVEIIYFVPDNKKQGGKYVSKIGYIKKIDIINQKIIMTDKSEISLTLIIDIKADEFFF